MSYKTLKTTLAPDGRLALPPETLPDYPVRVLVTILDEGTDGELAEVGDYHDRLTDYEERLARGEIRWQ